MQRSVSQTPPRVGGMQPGFVVCFCSEVIFMNLAERLQDLRKKAGYSQEQLANLLGISRQAVSKWESSQGKPEIDNIIKLTEIYHVSADYILLGTEPAASPAPAKKMPKEYRQAVKAAAILASAAGVTVLFITALALLATFVL